MTSIKVSGFVFALILSMNRLLAGPEPSVFTSGQAAAGKELYGARCSTCHGAELKGGTAPALAGTTFLRVWTPKSTWSDVYFILSSTMPPGSSSSLSPAQKAAITAYLLDRNGYPAGPTELAPDAPVLRQLVVQSQLVDGGQPAPAFIQGDAKSVAAGAGPNQQELNAATSSKRDWLYHTKDYSGARFARLDQLNPANVGQLRPVCAYQMGESSNFQTGPIVYHGVMYVTTTHKTVALDATTCKTKWRHTWQAKTEEVWVRNRGVAIKDGVLVRGTADGYLVELNAETGQVLWARRVADTSQGETLTMPPMLYEDMILIGPAGSEHAVSGWVGAFRISDGTEMWKFKTVPGAREGNSKSWPNPAGVPLGGGAVWTAFTLDPEKGELFVAVTNPAPDFPAKLRPGDNLYTNSVVILDVHTGKLLWYKQLIPNDSHDWDVTHASPLIRTKIQGRDTSVLTTAGKDGLLRALDRNSHETIYQTPVTTIENADAPVTATGVHACPGVDGGVEWNGPAYSPLTNLLYVGAVDWCGTYSASENPRYVPGQNFMGGGYRSDRTSQGWITAIDASTGKVRWRYRSPKPIIAALTVTSGNLVLAGELTGDFLVLDAAKGEVLYRFNTGGPMGGGIVTYEEGGKQYVAVASGSPSDFWEPGDPGSPTIFLFALP